MTIPHPRPSEMTLDVVRVPVSGSCPECGKEELQAYPVLSEEGWVNAVKCASCLCSVQRTPGPRLGPVELLSDSLIGERAS